MMPSLSEATVSEILQADATAGPAAPSSAVDVADDDQRSVRAAKLPTANTHSLHLFLGELLLKHDVTASSVRIVEDNAAVSLETRIWASASFFCSDNNGTHNKGICRWSSEPHIANLHMRRTCSSPLIARGAARGTKSSSSSARGGGRSLPRVRYSSAASFTGLSAGGIGRSNARWDTVPVFPPSSSMAASLTSTRTHQRIDASMVSSVPINTSPTERQQATISNDLPSSCRFSTIVNVSSFPLSSSSNSAPRLPNRHGSPGTDLGRKVRTVDDMDVDDVGNGVAAMKLVLSANDPAADSAPSQKSPTSIVSSTDLGLLAAPSLRSISTFGGDASSMHSSKPNSYHSITPSDTRGIHGNVHHQQNHKISFPSTTESQRRLRNALGAMAPSNTTNKTTNRSIGWNKQGQPSCGDNNGRKTTVDTAKHSLDIQKEAPQNFQSCSLVLVPRHDPHNSLSPILRDFDAPVVTQETPSVARV